MSNFLDIFIPLQKQLVKFRASFGWSEAEAPEKARLLVNNIINNIVDITGLPNLDITAVGFDSSQIVINPSQKRSQLFYDQLNNLVANGWTIQLPLDNPNQPETATLTTATQALTQNRIIQIAVNDIHGAQQPIYRLTQDFLTNYYVQEYDFSAHTVENDAAIITGLLAREVAHAENSNVNLRPYLVDSATGGDRLMENSLSIGAQMTSFLLSEGKALYNNIQITKDIGGFIPLNGPRAAIEQELNILSDPAHKILNGASAYYNQKGSGSGLPFIVDYWKQAFKQFTQNNPTLANQNILDELNKLDMTKVKPTNGFTLVQNADTTITMTISFQDGSSYVNRFGGYGVIAPSDANSGNVHQQAISPSPPGYTTYQRFNYADGTYLLDEYNVTINGQFYNEAVRSFTKANPADHTNDVSNIVAGADRLNYAQYNQTDANGNIISAYFEGHGAVANITDFSVISMAPNTEITIHNTYGDFVLSPRNEQGSGIIELPGGATVDGFGSTVNFMVEYISSGNVDPLDALVNLLSAQGPAITRAELEQAHYDYLNPAPVGTPYTVTGSVQKTSDSSADVYYSLIQPYQPEAHPAATVAGQATAEVTNYYIAYDAQGNPYEASYQAQVAATNILYAAGTITRDDISHVQVLSVRDNVMLVAGNDNFNFNSRKIAA